MINWKSHIAAYAGAHRYYVRGVVRTRIAKAVSISWSTGMPFIFMSSEWATRLFRLRARIRSTSGTAYARIYDVTSAAQLVQVSTTSATFSHLTSTTVTLTDTREYRVDFGVSSGGSGEWTYWDVFEVLA